MKTEPTGRERQQFRTIGRMMDKELDRKTIASKMDIPTWRLDALLRKGRDAKLLPAVKTTKPVTSNTIQKVSALRGQGMTYTEIATKLGMSRSHVNTIGRRAERNGIIRVASRNGKRPASTDHELKEIGTILRSINHLSTGAVEYLRSRLSEPEA